METAIINSKFPISVFKFYSFNKKATNFVNREYHLILQHFQNHNDADWDDVHRRRGGLQKTRRPLVRSSKPTIPLFGEMLHTNPV